MMALDNVLVVYKKSRYELYSSSPDEWLRDLAKGDSPDARLWRTAHDEQQQALETIVTEIAMTGVKYDIVYRASLKEGIDVARRDLVISVGGDGTFLEVAHYVSDVPVLGVNSDPNNSRGYFCAIEAAGFGKFFGEFDKAPTTTLNRMQVMLNEQPIPEQVLNDILIADPSPAAMIRYALRANGEEKPVRDNGLLVCTAAGSTGWMYNLGGLVMPLNSMELQYHSRDIRNAPFPMAKEISLRVQSREAIMFVDGQHLTYSASLGTLIDISQGHPLIAIGNLAEKQKAYLV